MGVVFAQQYNLIKMLELFRDKVEKATFSELRQMHDMEVYQSMNAVKITKKERMKVLSVLMFVTKKSDR